MMIKKLIEVILQDVIGFSTLFVGIIGGGFGLHQWRKSNVYKRGEIVKKLIEKVRDDEDIAIIMWRLLIGIKDLNMMVNFIFKNVKMKYVDLLINRISLEKLIKHYHIFHTFVI